MGHETYTPLDFNQYERDTRNVIYVAVVEDGLPICKRCGASGLWATLHPTCEDYRRMRREDVVRDRRYRHALKGVQP